MKKFVYFVSLLVFALLLVSCDEDANAYLYDDLGELVQEQKTLVKLLETAQDDNTRFSVIQKISENLKLKNKRKVLIAFLTTQVEKNPDDIYNAYWLLMVGNEYLSMEMPEVASYYLERVVTFYPDMTIKGKSMHHMSLNNLIKITNDPAKLVDYYSRLLNDLYDEINVGYVYFMLAQAYEKLGEWDSAIQTYGEFVKLRQFDIIIPGVPDSYNYARRIVDYASSSKSWPYESLDELVKTITLAIKRWDYNTLKRIKSQVNFFVMSWKQEAFIEKPVLEFDLTKMMYGHIKVDSELHPSSTPYEAYLRTVGWSQYNRVWYLYFKKINFPADPEIHGRWEWAGIYYGEKQ